MEKVSSTHASSEPPAVDLSQDEDTIGTSSSANTATPHAATSPSSFNADDPVSQPLPPLPISSHLVLDFAQSVKQADIDELADAMNPYPRQHPDKEECRRLAGQIVIQNNAMSITQGSFSRLSPRTWVCDEAIACYGQIIQLETEGVVVYPTHFMSTMLKFDDSANIGEHIHVGEPDPGVNQLDINIDGIQLVNDDEIELGRSEPGSEGEFYNFRRVERWHRKVANSRDIASIFCLDMLFIPINKNSSHWIFIMVKMQFKHIGLYEPYGRKPDNDGYLFAVRQYLFDASVDIYGTETTGTYDDWMHAWSVYDYSDEWPRQKDATSCGIFIMLGIHCLAHRIELTPSTFKQQDIYDHNVSLRIARVLWSYRSGEESPVAPLAIPPAAPSALYAPQPGLSGLSAAAATTAAIDGAPSELSPQGRTRAVDQSEQQRRAQRRSRRRKKKRRIMLCLNTTPPNKKRRAAERNVLPRVRDPTLSKPR